MQPVDVSQLVNDLLKRYRSRDWQTVEQLSRQILRQPSGRDKDKALALQLLSKVSDQSGNFSHSVELLRQANELCPNIVSLMHELAIANYRYGRQLRRTGELVAAERELHSALQLVPSSVAARCLLGVVFVQAGKLDEAETLYREALELRPDHLRSLINYGNLLARQTRHEQAIELYKRVLDRQTHSLHAILGASSSLLAVGRSLPAIQLLQRGVERYPRHAELHFNLGNAYFGCRRFQDAAEQFGAAVQLKPEWATARVMWLRSRAETCDWRDDWLAEMERLPTLISACLDRGEPSPLDPSQTPALPIPASLMKGIAVSKATEVRRTTSSAPLGELSNDRRLRIGYLSADLRHHAIGHLIHRLFACHDQQRYEIFVYSYGPDDQSHYREIIKCGCEHFVDLYEQNDACMLRRMQSDDLDILVDVMGFSGHGRAAVLAARPARLLVHYLGYPGSIGGLVDYFVTDPVSTPAEFCESPEMNEFAEALIRLPTTYQVNSLESPSLESPSLECLNSAAAVTRAACRLPESGFVYCCFNNNYKIQPEIFDVWMRILTGVPESALWLLSTQAETQVNLKTQSQLRGVDPERLVFADIASKADHLARHQLADLFLDTPVCNAHTTATDALHAGVPIVTCCGQRFTERVAASLLTAAGLEELITRSLQDYEALAIELANNPVRLRRLRGDWERRKVRSKLVDTATRTRELETAYDMIWRRYRDGLPPASIQVPASICRGTGS